MHFMREDEFLLLMNLSPIMDVAKTYGYLSVSDRTKLRNVGIQTAIEYPEWTSLEPAQGIYNFSSIENILSMNRSAGMKTIFAVPSSFFPTWIPNAWRLKYSDGNYNTASVSMWNVEARQYVKDFFKLLIATFHADDVMFILCNNDTGESAFPSYAFYDNFAIQDYKSKYGNEAYPDFDNYETKDWLARTLIFDFVELQKIFYPQYKEIWDAHQWLIAQRSPASMNYVQPNILEAYRETFGAEMSLVLLQYTYFDSSHPVQNEVYVDMLKNDYNCEVIVEAMFCEGLPVTTPKSIIKGFRGQIICPTHPHVQKKILDDSMIEAIRQSHNSWLESKNK